jgi:hypothetical protein
MCVVRNSPTKVLVDSLADQSAPKSVLDELDVSSCEIDSAKDGSIQLHSRSEHGKLLVNYMQIVTPSPAIQPNTVDEETPPPNGKSVSCVGKCSKSGKDDHSPSPQVGDLTPKRKASGLSTLSHKKSPKKSPKNVKVAADSPSCLEDEANEEQVDSPVPQKKRLRHAKDSSHDKEEEAGDVLVEPTRQKCIPWQMITCLWRDMTLL